ncbi:MAG: hypothetical protein IKC52_01290 [Clostridia bacterium]|nr:hypothetical protein [Clostridia bacterium]
MDFSQIKLENERSTHVTKRLNRTTTWKFFGILYRDDMGRVFAFSMLMLLCLAPMIACYVMFANDFASLQGSLPLFNDFGFSTGMWQGAQDHFNQQSAILSQKWGLWATLASIVLAITLSAGFAVVRDAFWTGKLRKVGLFRSFGNGFKANFLYALGSMAVIAFGVYGVVQFYVWAQTAMPIWLAIVLLVLLCIVLLFVVTYLLILCSVSVTYKQTFAQNVKDSWLLLWMNVLPNIIHTVFAFAHIGLAFLFSSMGGMLMSLFFAIMLMFGGLYMPLVWQCHMMRTFALFHPVETKKKK